MERKPLVTVVLPVYNKERLHVELFGQGFTWLDARDSRVVGGCGKLCEDGGGPSAPKDGLSGGDRLFKWVDCQRRSAQSL